MDKCVSIIIVNWNSGKQLSECVQSVLDFSSNTVTEVVIVDNGSTDNSLDAVSNIPDVTIIRAGENLGFAVACNKGAAQADTPYLLFLNPDTRLESVSLLKPLSFMEREENAGVGICGIQLLDEQGKVSRSCARFPTLRRFIASALGLDKFPGLLQTGIHMREWDHRNTRKVDHVIGAFYLIRKAVFDSCKGFDERFFVYLEDLDLSRRVNQAGWDSWYLSEARAFHAGGGTSRQVKAKRLFYSLSSRILYGFKHFPKWQAWGLVFITLTFEPVSRTIFSLIHRDFTGVKNTFSAYRMLTMAMPRLINGKSVRES